MAACGATIHSGGNIPRNHDFRVCLPFSLELAVQRLVRITVESQIPVETVFGHHDFDHKGFDDRFGNILPLVDIGVPFQCILKDCALFLVVRHQERKLQYQHACQAG